jgi:hypothetical protein
MYIRHSVQNDAQKLEASGGWLSDGSCVAEKSFTMADSEEDRFTAVTDEATFMPRLSSTPSSSAAIT